MRMLVLLIVVGMLTACSGDPVEDLPDVGNGSDLQADLDTPDDMPEADVEAEMEQDADSPASFDPAVPGPYRVGYFAEDRVYDARGQSERALRIAYWYPTREESGRTARYRDIFARPGVLARPTPADDGPRPVLLFSHGASSFAEQSFYMAEYFASHGWIVVACEHQFDTFLDGTGNANLAVAHLRPQDISATIDVIEDLEPDHLLAGHISETMVISGHSFGGYTTLALAGSTFDVDDILDDCQAEPRARWCDIVEDTDAQPLFRQGFGDPRLSAAIAKAAPGAEIMSVDEILIPVLLVTAGLDELVPNAENGDIFWRGLSGRDHLRLNYPRAGHFTFSNMCEVLPVELGDGCGEDFIPIAEVHPILNGISLSFLELHLFGSAQAQVWLEDTLDRYPDIFEASQSL